VTVDLVAEIEREIDCGAAPCANASFCSLCRDVDRRKDAGKTPRFIEPSQWHDSTTHIPRNWDAMSMDGLEHLFRQQRPTPQATIEVILYAVRERGVAALREPANIERLVRCDQAAKEQIDRRIAKLVRKAESHE
jgi:hypothetical protein